MDTAYETSITLSQDNIDQGVAQCPNNCVIANALWDHFGQSEHVSWIDVGYYMWKVKMRNGDYYEGNLCDAAQKIIANFDDGLVVEPCTIPFAGHKRSVI